METTLQRTQIVNHQLYALLEKLPANKIEELLDFGAFLLSRMQAQPKLQQLGDRFAGVWQDERSAEEIIAGIRSHRIEVEARETL